MNSFKLLLPNGGLVNQQTIFTVNGEKRKGTTLSEVELCKIMRGIWRKDVGSKNFQDWADELNATGDFEGTFTKEDALDNLCSAFHLNIGTTCVNVYDFYTKHLPLTA